MTADLSQSGEIQRWKTAAETAQQELQSFMTKVEDLTRELDRQRSEKAAAMEIARQFKEKAESLKEEVEKTKLGYSVFQEENQRLKQMVEEVKSAVTAEKKASFVAADEHKKEVGMLKEGSHEKDVLMQRASDDIKQLESQLTAAEGKYKELEECNRDILRSQEQANQDGMRQNEELEKLKEEVKVKTAQVTQFKKQLEGKNNTIPTEQVEKLQIELATSRSSLEDTAKQLKHLSFKHAEMEKQYAKKIQEIEKQLQVMKGENMRMVKESETHRKLLEKQKELQLNQAQMQQAEMANELTRLQRARNREDEFSKAFHEEFEAHRVMKAKYAELQHQLDAALDSLDEMRQKQEVLIQTLIYHRVEVPFVEPRQLPPGNMAQATAETLQWSTQPPTPVAISQKPIASPGVFNQGVDRLSYMPPHSNAEFQYQEQQAEQRVSHWQQQQHMYQQTGMERGGPPLSPQPQAALAVPSCQQADTDAVVGIPASAVIRPIVPRSSQHLSHTTHLPGALQSRHSDSEIQSGRVVREQQLYPLSPHRTCNPNAQLPLTVGEVSGMGQNQPQKAGHPQLQPGLRGKSQPNVYSGDPQQQQGGVVMGQPQPPNSDMGPAQMVNRGDPQPHGHSPHMDLSGGNFLARDQPPKHQNVFSPPSQAVEFVGQHDPYRQQPNSQAPSSRTPLMPVPSAETTNAATDLCFQRQQPLASQPYKTTLPGGAHPSQYPQAEFVKPVAETVLPPQACPSANPAVIEFNERSETGTTSVAPRKASDANDEEQGLMENLSTTIKATFEEINEEEPTPSIQSGLQSLPPDPNLQCVMCGKVFKIGQINFKRHSETCTGTRSK
ncbi:hypothetical protein GBAR_LOCUS4387 [Geodia barretti]|nr:hypothetical protein GBAR_LOCUS4387 [Geodia barretti]